MAKILKFPTPKEQKEKTRQDQIDHQLEESREAVEAYTEECVNLTQTMLQYIEDIIQRGDLTDWDVFQGMEFRDETYAESRDMFVIINLINAMMNRFVGIPHDLHKELDKQYLQMKAWSGAKNPAKNSEHIHETHEIDFEPGFEIFFEPDFEMNLPDDFDPDDNN